MYEVKQEYMEGEHNDTGVCTDILSGEFGIARNLYRQRFLKMLKYP